MKIPEFIKSSLFFFEDWKHKAHFGKRRTHIPKVKLSIDGTKCLESPETAEQKCHRLK